MTATPPVPAADPAADPAAMLADAAARHRAGALDEADRLYRSVLAASPDQPDALHLLGLIRHQRGDADGALALIERALQARPAFPMALSNLGNLRRARGEPAAARVAYEQALALRPGLSGAAIGLAGLDLDAGDAAGAAARLAAVVAAEPQAGLAWLELGHARRRARDLPGALDALDRAVALMPQSLAAHNERGIALHAAGRWAEAEQAYRQALACPGDHALVARNLGHALKRLGRTADAITCYRQATAHREPGAPAEPSRPTYATTSAVKLAHDLDQLLWLKARGWRPDAVDGLIADHRAVLDAVRGRGAPTETVRLTEAERARLGPLYNRLRHVADAPALPDGPFGGWNRGTIEDAYLAAQPELVVIDDFLSAVALESLRRYCLESTVWFDFGHTDGYLAAFIDDRFDAPLVVQIADGLRAALPRVLGRHSLVHVWAYKHGPRLEGVGIHGDNAAVNVNFWITPEDRNLDPASGGVVVYPALAPLDWRFEDFNADTPRIRAFLAADGRPPIRVPYRANRAVVFNSSLFHETDRLRFAPEYDARRINITMLFGDRGG